MPDFHEAYLELGQDLHFLMVNVTDGSWDTEESASSFLEEEGYTFPALYDTDSSATGAYGVYALPATYFIDGEGYVAAWAGGMIDGETLRQGIGMILEEHCPGLGQRSLYPSEFSGRIPPDKLKPDVPMGTSGFSL